MINNFVSFALKQFCAILQPQIVFYKNIKKQIKLQTTDSTQKFWKDY